MFLRILFLTNICYYIYVRHYKHKFFPFKLTLVKHSNLKAINFYVNNKKNSTHDLAYLENNIECKLYYEYLDSNKLIFPVQNVYNCLC